MNLRMIWGHALTGLNESSSAAEMNKDLNKGSGRIWIAFIAVLAVAVIGLNAAIFILIQTTQRSIEGRETELQRRQVAVEAKEGQRDGILTEINGLESRKALAQRQADEAQKAAADAARVQADRDRVFRDWKAAESDLAKGLAELGGLRAQVTAARAEEAAARQARD